MKKVTNESRTQEKVLTEQSTETPLLDSMLEDNEQRIPSSPTKKENKAKRERERRHKKRKSTRVEIDILQLPDRFLVVVNPKKGRGFPKVIPHDSGTTLDVIRVHSPALADLLSSGQWTF